MAAQTTTVTALQGDTLDQVCLRHLGATAGLVEQTLALNPGLAALGPDLPLGTPILLPTQQDTCGDTFNIAIASAEGLEVGQTKEVEL